MNPEMMILEHLCQVLVFWAVCLVGWATVKVIERRNRAAKLSQKCRNRAAKLSQKCRNRAAKLSQKCRTNAAEVSHKCRKETGRRAA